MRRYGYAIRVGGDPEISGALAAGIRAGTDGAQALAIGAGALEAVRAEIDRQAIEAWMREQDILRELTPALVRAAVGDERTAADYRRLMAAANGAYGGMAEPLPAALGWLLAGYGLICWAIRQGWQMLINGVEGR